VRLLEKEWRELEKLTHVDEPQTESFVLVVLIEVKTHKVKYTK